MRDPERIKKILGLLESYWTANPDLRLCQILGNITKTAKTCSYCQGEAFHKVWISGECKMQPCLRCIGYGIISISNYDVEDDVLINALEDLNELQKSRT